MDWLTRSNPVAEPNPTTTARVQANAKSWAEGSLETMEHHYRQTVLSIIPLIMETDHKDWDGAWEIATKWMVNRYKGKFNVEILDWARREISPFRRATPTRTPTTTATGDSPSTHTEQPNPSQSHYPGPMAEPKLVTKMGTTTRQKGICSPPKEKPTHTEMKTASSQRNPPSPPPPKEPNPQHQET